MSYEQDHVFATLQRARNSNFLSYNLRLAWEQHTGERVRAIRIIPGLTEYEPFEQARLVARALVAPDDSAAPVQKLNLFVQIFASRVAVEEALIPAQSMPALPAPGPTHFFIPESNCIVWNLPNAPNMREVGSLLGGDAFSANLLPAAEREYVVTPELVDYVPLKWAQLAWEHPVSRQRLIGKIFGKENSALAAYNWMEVNRCQAQGRIDIAIPELLTWNQHKRALLRTALPGRPVTDEPMLLSTETMRQLGRALAQLHRLPIDTVERRNAAAIVAGIREDWRRVGLVLPEAEESLADLWPRLEAARQQLDFPEEMVVHGRLFADRVYVDQNGDVGIDDWDVLSLGDGLFDVARFLAHLIYLSGAGELSTAQVQCCVRELLAAYAQEQGAPVAQERLQWHLATQLLRQGPRDALRSLPEKWPEQLHFVVRESERLLSGQSAYLPAAERRQTRIAGKQGRARPPVASHLTS